MSTSLNVRDFTFAGMKVDARRAKLIERLELSAITGTDITITAAEAALAVDALQLAREAAAHEVPRG